MNQIQGQVSDMEISQGLFSHISVDVLRQLFFKRLSTKSKGVQNTDRAERHDL